MCLLFMVYCICIRFLSSMHRSKISISINKNLSNYFAITDKSSVFKTLTYIVGHQKKLGRLSKVRLLCVNVPVDVLKQVVPKLVVIVFKLMTRTDVMNIFNKYYNNDLKKIYFKISESLYTHCASMIPGYVYLEQG